MQSQVFLLCLLLLLGVSVSASVQDSITPSYNETSQVWALSFLSGLANGHTANSTSVLLQETVTATNQMLNNTYVQSLIGTWDVVWGPAIYSRRSEHIADYCVFIAKQRNEPTWTLSIAGTNPLSLLDWMDDIRVRLTIPWHRIVRSAPRSSGSIARGTHNGLMGVMDMTDESGKTIIEFLRDTSFPGNSTFYVTGHSLGGALTSVVGLYIIDNEASWKTSDDSVAIKFRPTAGPTPGDSAWNDYFFTKIGSDPSAFLSEINTIDIVPQAWDATTLAQVPYFYTSCIPFNDLLNDTVHVTIEWANGQYQQMPKQSYFDGEFTMTGSIECNSPSELLNVDFFLQEAGYQHMNGYYEPLGICNFIQAFNCVADEVYTGKPLPAVTCHQNITCDVLPDIK